MAISRALVVLGAEREAVHVDILEGASPGVFGIGRRKARVRATMRAPIEQWLAFDPPEADREPLLTSEPQRTPQSAARSGKRRERKRAGARDAEARTAANSESASTLGPSTSRAALSDAIPTVPEPAVIVQEIFRRLGVAVTVADSGTIEVPGEPQVENVPTPRLLSLVGSDVEDGIGCKGEVLEAIEYLLNRMLDHTHAGQRVALDAAGYRAKRLAALENVVRRMATRARERRRPVTLDPMSPGDRLLVVELLKGEHGVTGRSIGQGFYRKQMLTPEGARTGGGKKSR